MLSSGNVNKININSDPSGSFQARGRPQLAALLGRPQGGLGIAGTLLLALVFLPINLRIKIQGEFASIISLIIQSKALCLYSP